MVRSPAPVPRTSPKSMHALGCYPWNCVSIDLPGLRGIDHSLCK